MEKYKTFQNAIYTLTPHQQILGFLKEAPFKIDDNKFSNLNFGVRAELPIEEIKALLRFCELNRENFFEYCYLEKSNNAFFMGTKTAKISQIHVPQKALYFIDTHLGNNFKILPNEFSDSKKDNSAIIKDEDFYLLLIRNLNVDEYRDELIDILAYDEPKREFIKQLSEIRFIAGEKYDSENFEFKILNFACSFLKEADYPKFRKKIIIETSEQDLTLAEIPPFADKIKIEGYDLSLAKILPKFYQNSNYLGEFIKIFIGLGLPQNKLYSLLNISQEPEPESIFALLLKGEKLLENEEQLAFLILYDRIEKVNFEKFEVETLDSNYHLGYSYYTKKQPFISNCAVLSSKYANISKIFSSLPFGFGKETQLLKTPCFGENTFVCPFIIEDMLDEQKLSFVEFLFNQWDKKDKKTIIKNIDWSKIEEIETVKLLGFNPNYSVYPCEYALESEELPEYLQKWVADDSAKISFMSDFGVFTEKSTLVSLRKSFLSQGSFNQAKIAQDSSLADEIMLFNTIEWLKEKELELENQEEFEIFKEIVRVINSNRVKGQELVIQDEYDFELLESKMIEWDTPYYNNWKKELEDKFSIYLFEGALPKIVKLDEVEDYIFYRYNEGNIVIDDENNIYVNCNGDIKKALGTLISDENDGFLTEDLLLLYQTEEAVQGANDEVVKLKNEIERLNEEINNLRSGNKNNDWKNSDTFFDDFNQVVTEREFNLITGYKAEAYVYEQLKNQGFKNVVWTNQASTATNQQIVQSGKTYFIDEKGEPYDLTFIDGKGRLCYIQVKATTTTFDRADDVKMIITKREWLFLQKDEYKDVYYMTRVFSARDYPTMKFFKMEFMLGS